MILLVFKACMNSHLNFPHLLKMGLHWGRVYINTVMKLLTLASALAIPAVALFAQAAHAEDLQFTLKNDSSSRLVQFYVEAASVNTWGENILYHSIKSGESGKVLIEDGKTTCTYDIKGVFADGSHIEEENINLCELGSYTYHDEE